MTDIENEIVGQSNVDSEVKTIKKKEKSEPTAFKTKLILSTDRTHPLSILQGDMKKRGIKVDIADVILEALDQVPCDWWNDKLVEMTPLEFRVNAALADPEMREKLSNLLAEQEAAIN